MPFVEMTTRSAGYIVPASEWNQLIDNDNDAHAHTIAASEVHGLAADTYVLGVYGAGGIFAQSGADEIATAHTPHQIYWIAPVAQTFDVAYAAPPIVWVSGQDSDGDDGISGGAIDIGTTGCSIYGGCLQDTSFVFAWFAIGART